MHGCFRLDFVSSIYNLHTSLVFLERKAAFCVIFCTLSLLVLEIVASTSNNDNLRVYDSFRGAMEELFTVCESTDSFFHLMKNQEWKSIKLE